MTNLQFLQADARITYRILRLTANDADEMYKSVSQLLRSESEIMPPVRIRHVQAIIKLNTRIVILSIAT